MTSQFILNLISSGLNVVKSLILFKILTFFSPLDLMSKYFAVKAFSSIIYYLLSLKISDIFYVYRGQLNYNESQLNSLQFSISFIFFIILLSSLTFGFIFLSEVYIYILAFFIFYLNEIIEVNFTSLRYFDKYYKMIILRLVLLLQPLLLYLSFSYELISFDLKEILFVEIIILVFFLLIWIIFNLREIKTLKKYLKIFTKNKDFLYNTWLNSISKISFDSLPNYLLSTMVSDFKYVSYNVARKIFGSIDVGLNSIIQVLNNYSFIHKKNKEKYYKLFVSILGSCLIFSLIITFTYGSYIIEILSKKTYANDITIICLLILIGSKFIYIFLHPIKQFLILDGFIRYLSYGAFFSIIIITISNFLFIKLYDIYYTSIIISLGYCLIILLAVLIRKIKHED